VTYDPQIKVQKQLTVTDMHYDKDCVILKMTQKFELDPERPAEEQIRKTEINLVKNKIFVYYHYKQGEIVAPMKMYRREDISAQAKLGDMNDKESEETQEQQTFKRINEIERRCHEEINEDEKNAKNETTQRRNMEKNI